MDRPLAGLERLYWLIGAAQSANGVVVATVRGALDPKALERTFAAACDRHPHLAVRIEERSDGPWFVSQGVAPPPIRVAQREGGPDDAPAWARATEQEMATPFDVAQGPLVRVAVLQGRGPGGEPESDVLMTLHHSVGDGTAGYGVLREVLAAASGAAPLPPGRVDAPPIGALLPEGISTKPTAGQVVRTLVQRARGHPDVLPREGDAPAGKRTSRVIHRLLDADATTALVEACKAERTTVHGALAAAHLLAAASEINEGRGGTIGLANPVNLRPYLARPLGDAFGYYSFGVTTLHKATPHTPFWKLARDVAAKVQRELERRTALSWVAMFEGFPKTAAAGPALVQRIDSARMPAVGVSNLGRLQAPALGPLEWTGFHGAGGVDTQGSHLLSGAMTFQGRLDLTFLHPEPLVTAARAERMVGVVMDRLRVTPPRR